jgi:hypothetical protein
VPPSVAPEQARLALSAAPGSDVLAPVGAQREPDQRRADDHLDEQPDDADDADVGERAGGERHVDGALGEQPLEHDRVGELGQPLGEARLESSW